MPMRRGAIFDRDTMCCGDVESGGIRMLDDIAHAARIGSRRSPRSNDMSATQAGVADLWPDVECLKQRVEFVAGKFDSWSGCHAREA